MIASLRLRYENGHFVPLDEVPELEEGEEIEVMWEKRTLDPEVQAMLDRTRGLWAELEGVEEFLDQARKTWDDEWQKHLDWLIKNSD